MLSNSAEDGAEQAARDWVAARRRPGNWYDIAPTDEIPRTITPDFFVLLQMFQFRFAPEIRKRLAEGRIDDSFVLRMAQFVQRDNTPPEVRLNEEIRGEAAVRANRDVREGDSVRLGDLDGVEEFDLKPDDMDAGHFTAFCATNGSWRGFFDFRMWRRLVGKLLEVADEFLAAARLARINGLKRASIDALFTACENTAKAHLILYHHPHLRSSKTHRVTHSAINRWSQLGNVDKGFTTLFNRLFEKRNPARYDTDIDIAPPSNDDFALVEAEIDALRDNVSGRVARTVGAGQSPRVPNTANGP